MIPVVNSDDRVVGVVHAFSECMYLFAKTTLWQSAGNRRWYHRPF
jgi:hypothetical protein